MIKNKNFVLSGIIAVSFYLFVLIAFFIYITNSEVQTYKFKTKTTVLQLDMIEEISKNVQVQKKVEKKIEQKIEPKKEASRTNEKKADLKSLFGNVKTKAVQVRKKEINNIRKSIDPKRFKSKFEKEKKSSNVNVDKLLTSVKTTTNIKKINTNNTSDEQSDEYYSKINEMLSIWTPNITEGGLISNVIISIDSKGNFKYRFVKYSNNDSFNNSLKSFLDEQVLITYPIPKNSSTVSISVDFKSKR